MNMKAFALLLLLPLAGCMNAGGRTYEDLTRARVAQISAMGEGIARDATHKDVTTACPKGMELVRANVTSRSAANTRYREDYGTNRNGGRWRGGQNGFLPRGRLQIDTRQNATGVYRCQLVSQSSQRPR